MRDLHQLDLAPSDEMAARLEADLLRRLVATAPVAAVDHHPPLRLLPVDPPPAEAGSRRSGRRRLLVAAAIAIVAVSILAVGVGDRDRVQTPTGSTPPPATTPPPTTAVDASDRIGSGPWYVDFDASGIDPSSPWAPGAGTLAATLDFETRSEVHGGAGYGGGCEDWRAPVHFGTGTSLTIGTPVGTDCATSQNQGEVRPDYAPAAAEIRRRLLTVRSFEETDHRLTLRDDSGAPVLVLDDQP